MMNHSQWFFPFVYTWPLGDKQYQLSRGDEFHYYNLLTLIDSISMIFSQGNLGLGFACKKVHFMNLMKVNSV